MNHSKLNKALCLSPVFILAFLTLPQLALARAGGGGGGGRGSLIINLIFLPFFLIYSAIMTHLVNKKSQQAKMLMEQIAFRDSEWDPDFIKRNIETAFFKVQQAWMERDQNIAADYLSEALYKKHKLQTDIMISEHRKNILDRINLIEARVVQVADFKNNEKDQMWVYINGSMIDYVVDDRSMNFISGKTDEPEKFAELWKFIRGGKGWVLDEIDQNVSIGDLKHLYSVSEVDYGEGERPNP